MKNPMASKAKRIFMKKTAITVACVLAIVHYLSHESIAQSSGNVVYDSLYSNILKEQRKIRIVFPNDYHADSTKRYDVIYVTDGEWNTEMVSQIHTYGTDWEYMPKNIIVGIENFYKDGVNQRSRDFVPTHNEVQPLSGKADAFLSFLKDELLPYIESSLPVTGDNTLVGHSHGGTFAIYSLLREHQLFKSYIAIDPSLWWDDQYVINLATEKLMGQKDMKATLHISGVEGEAFKRMGISQMDSVLAYHAPVGLRWETAAYPNETHISLKLKGIYDGFKFSYQGYTRQPATFHPMGGIIEKGRPYLIFAGFDSRAVRYTTDGTEPDYSSPLMKDFIELEGPAVLKMKPVSIRWPHSETTTGYFTEGNTLKPKANVKNIQPGGLKYTYFEGEWDKLPDFTKLKPLETGVADEDFNLSKLPRENNFACLFEGFLEIEKEGYYVFAIASDDGSKLYLDDTLLVDHDGCHDDSVVKSYMVPLREGFYPYRLEYFQKDGGAGYQVFWVTPGDKNALPLPLDMLYHKE